MVKKALVCGAGGFIGGHLVNRLKIEGYWVRGVDLKENEYGNGNADEFIIGDLRNPAVVANVTTSDLDEIYQLAADMGGAGFVFTGENDSSIMHNSALINLNVLEEAKQKNIQKIFYSSSACMYPEYNQLDPDSPKCSEDSAYPAAPDSEYGWEKLFSERLFLTYQRNHGIQVRVARFHNIFGPMGTWNGGREKAPAAICRKVAEAPDGGVIEIWGDGRQTRSFLIVDECVDGLRRLMESDFTGPVNIGSEEMISINDFAKMVIDISGKNLTIKNIPGPTGVRGRNSDNALIKEKLGWAPSQPLRKGVEETFDWITEQLAKNNKIAATAEEKILQHLNTMQAQVTAHGQGKKYVFLANNESTTALTQFAYGEFLPGENCAEHLHPTMEECFYFIKGSGIYIIDGIEFTITPGSFLRIPPGKLHSLMATGDKKLEFVYFGVATQ
ncbi:MAG TPA: NAD-dependent epimerase/dehydratase family protein [Chitinophagaceae bacterium]|nr:NAD-dependent epimerase/dehydratase family protein [Chitinophagaceae bacterium]